MRVNAKTRWTAVIGGLTILIIYFTMDSCKPDSCPTSTSCQSLNGFDFECEHIAFPCDANACCENGPNPLCCVNGGICSNKTFVYNGTNLGECQCLCDDEFAGMIDS